MIDFRWRELGCIGVIEQFATTGLTVASTHPSGHADVLLPGNTHPVWDRERIAARPHGESRRWPPKIAGAVHCGKVHGDRSGVGWASA